MDIPDQDTVVLQAVRFTQSIGLNTGSKSNPERGQQVGSEAETQPEPTDALSPQAVIQFRIQQLHNRRFLLLNTQHLRKKADDNNGRTTEETASGDGEHSGDLCELEVIQKELEELLAQKEELEKQEKRSKLRNGQQDVCPTFYKSETPQGGIYLLPPPLPTQEDITLEQRVRTRFSTVRPTGPVIPVDHLGQNPDVTQCPSCQEVVFTETRSKVGEAVWMLCCLCSMMGCVAGCCLIPFFMDHLKDVHHKCPQCKAHIHTNQRF